MLETCILEAPIITTIPATETNTIGDGWKKASVKIQNREDGYRTYTLTTNAPLRDNDPPDQKVVYDEKKGQPIVRSGNDIFDALFALAHDEVRKNSVESIKDGSFNHDQPVNISAFETGEKWHYVWTRDIAYSAHLALANVDPNRTKNSLQFKTAKLKSDDNPQIIQDTGTGGSYPISNDRVVWALGAYELLKFLEDSERKEFLKTAYPVITNSVEQDRKMLVDPKDGLYRGEESFLDWREQSYPDWTYNDTLQIGISKALSTNILHYKSLDIASKLAEEMGEPDQKSKYQKWAEDLKDNINKNFYLNEAGLYSAMIFGDMCPIKMNSYDLLGEALAVCLEVADRTRAASVVSGYPHTHTGAPAVFPQRDYLKPYHNRSIWPFTIAYWIKAAAKVKNPAVVDHGIQFLMKNAALNLSNMENAQFLDGDNFETAINSRRQLWSVAGYIGVVNDVVFGLDASRTGIRFLPFITNRMRRMFKTNQITLENFSFQKKKIKVIINLPPSDADQKGYYDIARVIFNQREEIGTNYIDFARLTETNTVEIDLSGLIETPGQIKLLDDWVGSHWAPKEPFIESVRPVDGKLKLEWSLYEEKDIRYHIYRDGSLKEANYNGVSWVDADSADYPNHTYFYAVQAVNRAGNVSFPSRTISYCQAPDALQTVAVDWEKKIVTSNGGELSNNHGKNHYQNWGARDHKLVINKFQPQKTGYYQVSLLYGNGSGPINSGITCSVKKISIQEKDSGEKPVEGVVVMPQLGWGPQDKWWDRWGESSAIKVRLDASKLYEIKIFEDIDKRDTINMSFFDTKYTGGAGGGDTSYNYVNIAQVNFLFVHQ